MKGQMVCISLGEKGRSDPILSANVKMVLPTPLPSLRCQSTIRRIALVEIFKACRLGLILGAVLDGPLLQILNLLVVIAIFA